MSWQLLFKTVYIAYWKINQDYITENYCVNKDKPKMHCNGKCHLAKQLEKAEETKQEKSKFPTEIFKFNSVDNFIVQDYQHTYRQLFYTLRTNKLFPFNSFSLSSGHIKINYQPPEFS